MSGALGNGNAETVGDGESAEPEKPTDDGKPFTVEKLKEALTAAGVYPGPYISQFLEENGFGISERIERGVLPLLLDMIGKDGIPDAAALIARIKSVELGVRERS